MTFISYYNEKNKKKCKTSYYNSDNKAKTFMTNRVNASQGKARISYLKSKTTANRIFKPQTIADEFINYEV